MFDGLRGRHPRILVLASQSVDSIGWAVCKGGLVKRRAWADPALRFDLPVGIETVI